MQQSVHTFFQFDEGTIVGQVADSSRDLATNRVLVADVVPRVGLSLFHTQRNFLFLFVDSQNHHVDFITDSNQFARMVHSPCPRHFTDVDKAFDAVFQLNKGTIRQHIDDFALDDGIDRVLFADIFPRALGLLLQTKSDLFFVIVNVQDHDLDLFIDLHHLRRMVNASPAHIGNVQQTINTTEVDEGTEVRDILNRTCAKVANFEVAEKFLFHLLACFFDQSATRNNNVSTRFVDLQNHALDVLADVVSDVRRTTHINLTGRQKDIHAVLDDGLAVHLATNRNQQTALDFANNWSLDDVPFVVSLDDLFPVADTICFPLRQDDQANGIFEFLQQHFDR